MTRRLLCLFTLTLTLAACAPKPVSPAPAPGTLFSDDFSSPLSGWDRHAAPDISTDYRDGQYLIAVNQSRLDVWATPGLSFDDAVLSVEAIHAAGSPQDEFGLMCRFRKSGAAASFYFFVIRDDGSFAAGKVLQGQRATLAPAAGDFAPLDSIATGPAAVNHLSASCAGNQFAFSVNGAAAADFADDSLARGDVGLLAGTFAAPGLQALFDNFLLRKP